jgi:hypothetical protein
MTSAWCRTGKRPGRGDRAAAARCKAGRAFDPGGQRPRQRRGPAGCRRDQNPRCAVADAGHLLDGQEGGTSSQLAGGGGLWSANAPGIKGTGTPSFSRNQRRPRDGFASEFHSCARVSPEHAAVRVGEQPTVCWLPLTRAPGESLWCVCGGLGVFRGRRCGRSARCRRRRRLTGLLWMRSSCGSCGPSRPSSWWPSSPRASTQMQRPPRQGGSPPRAPSTRACRPSLEWECHAWPPVQAPKCPACASQTGADHIQLASQRCAMNGWSGAVSERNTCEGLVHLPLLPTPRAPRASFRQAGQRMPALSVRAKGWSVPVGLGRLGEGRASRRGAGSLAS